MKSANLVMMNILDTSGKKAVRRKYLDDNGAKLKCSAETSKSPQIVKTLKSTTK